ncbi:hypothetical protein [Paenibacillus sp. FSL R7-0337]|uniref:hypothetical protein n=1 Tax=Paenibacillus sp. FSL R7-0337 TaxID=1926588 RepID=UPI00096D89BE|nr:hypothetical protein [Paenibacillus sp. FSL R7-0337]OMF92592.1 hypothetical protein BK147_20050 [Paenibacillus sp. FSL R7-0337]
MKKSVTTYLLVIAGLLLLAGSLYLIRTVQDPQGIMRTLPYICIGLGSGVFGSGMGELIGQRALKQSPATAKELEINKNDERNIAIATRAKAKAYDMMVYIFGALMLALALMETELTVVLLLVFAYLFTIGYGIYYRFKYDREM